MSEVEAIRIKCTQCARVKVVVISGSMDLDEIDLEEAKPGEYVERFCNRCGRETDHRVLDGPESRRAAATKTEEKTAA